MLKLPKDVELYSQLPRLESSFTATSIPFGLRNNHATLDGTWGVIRILQGKLEYILLENDSDDDTQSSFELSPERPGIIVPERSHQVKALTDDVEFVVEFYRKKIM